MGQDHHHCSLNHQCEDFRPWSLPVQKWIYEPVTVNNAIDKSAVPDTSSQPVEQREEEIEEAVQEGEVEVEEVDRAGGDEHVEEAGDGVEGVDKY